MSAKRHLSIRRIVMVGILVLAAGALAGWFGWRHTTKESTPAVTTSPRPKAPAPASARGAAGFSNPRIGAVGISADGWLAKDAQLSLAGGPVGVLTVQGTVPVANQQLDVFVGGHRVASGPVGAGPLSLRLLIPAAEGNRRIQLRFARTVKLKPPDNRDAAAQLDSIDVRPLRSAPKRLRLPADLTRESAITTGIEGDGWTHANASFALAGGGPATLVLRGEVPPLPNDAQQQLTVAVDGATVVDEAVAPGALDLRVPLASSPGARAIDLRWSGAARLSQRDPRRLAARLSSVALAPLHGVTQLRLPSDLAKTAATYSGIYGDGWAQRVVRVVLAAGPTAKLAVDTTTPRAGQHVTVLVDSQPLVRTELAGGRDTIEVPLGPSARPRVVELRFARVDPIATNDPRPAATLLRRVALDPIGAAAPGVVRIPADLSHAPLVYSGIYRDGWAEDDVRLVIAGGPATALTMKALTRLKGQRVTVLVNGTERASPAVRRGRSVVHVNLPRSGSPRLVELRFARSAPIAANDPRRASALLSSIAIRGGSRTARATKTPSLHADLTMSAVVPPLSGSAGGKFTARLSGSTMRWHFETHGLSGPIIAAVIHSGGSGTIGPSLADLCRPCTATASGTLQLPTAVIAAIKSDDAYLNVGTTDHPYGEIRGRIVSG